MWCPHAATADEALSHLESSHDGLLEPDVERRLEQYGPNRLPTPPRESLLARLLRQIRNVLIYILLAAALITALLGHWADTSVIIAVVVVNAVLGFIQEGKAEKAMQAVSEMLAPQASVLRAGLRHSIAAEDVVPGDIVLLEAGERVPADLRLLRSHGLQIQEAILTGESLPVEKNTRPVEKAANLGDRSCMAFSGTLVTAGQGVGVVVATGTATEIGRISGLLSGVEHLVTPLVRQMDLFARWLTLFILLVAGLILAYGYAVHGMPFTALFMAVVGLSVAAIPEGLPAVLTITLAIGVRAMAQRNAIIRRLPAIETVGAVSVICSDKTGTLTKNEMTVASVVHDAETYTVEGSGYAPEGELRTGQKNIDAVERHALQEMGRIAALCNDAHLQEKEGHWSVQGDPMEGALLVLARKLGLLESQEQQHWTRTDAIPFDPNHRFMATLNHNHEGGAAIFIKGAPEAVLDLCQWQRDRLGNQAPLDRDYWHAQMHQIAGEGQRVLALALKPVPPEHAILERNDLQEDVMLIGLVGLIDPPRPEAIEAVTQCYQAGIAVKMITGDHAGTARAIARQVGLRHWDRVLTGNELDALSDAELPLAVKKTDVFARTSPEHKLRLVMALQAEEHVVAMTGDGVNDAPALKRADAGIAMGLKGSGAAREASDLVLADDNFASIVAAIREGRTVYDNIKKVIGWTLPTNSGEALTIVVALLLGVTLPVTPLQILWVNTVTAVTLGIALAFEPTEDTVMRRPPRRRNEPLLGHTLLWHLLFVSIVFLAGVYGIYAYAGAQGYSTMMAQTMAVNTLVVMEIFHLFFMRNFYSPGLALKMLAGTPMVWATVGVLTIAQFAFTFLGPFQAVFGTEAVAFKDGLLVVAIGVAVFALLELEKQVLLRSSMLRMPPPPADSGAAQRD
ncbi:HAD-IC family P-type ATPase [Marinobacteraceae bacterium S3BR75-40.1]